MFTGLKLPKKKALKMPYGFRLRDILVQTPPGWVWRTNYDRLLYIEHGDFRMVRF